MRSFYTILLLLALAACVTTGDRAADNEALERGRSKERM